MDFPVAKEGGQVVANFTGVISSVKRGGNHGDPMWPPRLTVVGWLYDIPIRHIPMILLVHADASRRRHFLRCHRAPVGKWHSGQACVLFALREGKDEFHDRRNTNYMKAGSPPILNTAWQPTILTICTTSHSPTSARWLHPVTAFVQRPGRVLRTGCDGWHLVAAQGETSQSRHATAGWAWLKKLIPDVPLTQDLHNVSAMYSDVVSPRVGLRCGTVYPCLC